MPKNMVQKLISSHLISGTLKPKEEIALKIDQTLTQDATGTMVMLELDAMGCKRVKTEISAQYVDHNLLQTDFKNADDHVFLQSACQKFGIHYSRAGNGVSHPVHMERFGIPLKTLLGSDSHTCAAGSLGMLAIGIGGLEVAMAMMGEPLYIRHPLVVGVKLSGSLPKYVSAKDVILEMLRRFDVNGGIGKIFEYYGPGLSDLSAMDRHVIANMGAELGATTSVFPSDAATKYFLKQQNREHHWQELLPDKGCTYDEHVEIDLNNLEPLLAKPQSPGKVVPVKEEEGKNVYQCMIGSSANPGIRDFAVPAMMLENKKIHDRVSLDINPTSRQILVNLLKNGYLSSLVKSGARIHQAGCNGCIGMGQAPATKKISMRTVPRNFPGRSGTKEDMVYLCSPETAAASAITGVITDPRSLKIDYPKFKEIKNPFIDNETIIAPNDNKKDIELKMGPNIKPLPRFEELPKSLNGPILLKVGNNVSTDEILPAGARVLPFRSNIEEISKFTFWQIDENFHKRAKKVKDKHSFIVGGTNYGQGSSREHAAIAVRYLGIRAVLAISYARIYRENLINFGILPLTFNDAKDFDTIEQDDEITLNNLHDWLKGNEQLIAQIGNKKLKLNSDLSNREKEFIKQGSLINLILKKKKPA